MIITLPYKYQNAAIRQADMTGDMYDLYNVVQQINLQSERQIQTVVATEGQNIQMLDNPYDGTLYLKPAAPLTNLTITFPTIANSKVNQIRFIASTKGITNLTLAGMTLLGSIMSMNANDCFAFQQVEAGVWIVNQ